MTEANRDAGEVLSTHPSPASGPWTGKGVKMQIWTTQRMSRVHQASAGHWTPFLGSVPSPQAREWGHFPKQSQRKPAVRAQVGCVPRTCSAALAVSTACAEQGGWDTMLSVPHGPYVQGSSSCLHLWFTVYIKFGNILAIVSSSIFSAPPTLVFSPPLRGLGLNM